MTGQESNTATLFQLYVDHGRYTEATTLLLEYIESFASMVNCNLFLATHDIHTIIKSMKLHAFLLAPSFYLGFS